MPTLADIAKVNKTPAFTNAGQKKPARKAGASSPSQKPPLKTRQPTSNRPNSPQSLGGGQPTPAQNPSVEDIAENEDFATYLAMRLGISPKRTAAALADYTRRLQSERPHQPVAPTAKPTPKAVVAPPSEPRDLPPVPRLGPIVSQGEAASFRWVGESMASADHRERNEDSWVVFAPANAFGVFDGVTVATGAADASAQAREMFIKAARGLLPGSANETAQSLRQILERMNDKFVRANANQQSTHLAATAAVGIVVRQDNGYQLAYALVGDTRVGVWHAATKRYELAELDDGFLRMLLLPVANRPAWVGKLLASHGLDSSLRLSISEASRLAIALDQAHDPASVSAQAKALFAERNLISQSLGSPGLQIHSGVMPLASKDRVIVTSDGIHDNLLEAELTQVGALANLTEVASALVVRAHEISLSSSPRAKQDDMTAVVLEIK